MRFREARKSEAKQDGKLSLQDFVSKVRDAFNQQYPAHQLPTGEWVDRYCNDVFDDHIIAHFGDDGMYSIPFTVENNQVIFANAEKWQKVEKAWVTVTEALRVLAARKKETDSEGREWEVVIIGPETEGDLVTEGKQTYIKSKNGRLYATSALEASVTLWDGIKVYDNHLTDQEMATKQGMRSVVQEWVGVITNPVWDSTKKAVTGVLKVVDETLRTKLVNAEKAGVLGAIGLSIDALGEAIEATVAGKKTPVVEKISKALSVDVVADPAAGGRLARMIAGTSPLQSKPNTEDMMDPEELKALLESLLGERVGALSDELTAKFDTLLTEAIAKMQKPTGEETPPAGENELPDAITEALKKAEELVAEAEKKARLAECSALLSQKLVESGLPESFRTKIAKQFRGKTFEEKDLDEVIADEKAALTAITESGRVIIPDGARINVSPLTELDRYSLAFLRLVAGNNRFNELATKENAEHHGFESLGRFVEAGKSFGDVPLPRRLSEWYYQFTEDYDGMGLFRNRRLLEANVTSTSVASIVKNTVNLLMAADYSVRQRWWEPIVRNEDVDTLDQATLVRLYGVSDLEEISEGGPYTETNWGDDEETASWYKRGNFIGVTLETFLLDKLAKLRSLPNRLSNAWYNTISTLVSNVFTTNNAAGPVLSDTGALFNNTALTTTGGHANLLTSALSWTAYDAVVTAMMAQTDQKLGAGKKLMITPRYLLVPTTLRSTAYQIRNTENVPGSANYQRNPYGPDGGDARPEVVVVPDWTDATDWACVADPNQFPAIWLIWLRGRRTPELFTAEDEKSGSMFTNDTLLFKVRQYGFRYSSTYDCAPVADFRPLHKSNVAG